MNKRKLRAPRKPRPGDVVKLPGGRAAHFVREDIEGQPTEHFRLVDTLYLMFRNGTIDLPMHDAGQAFANDFVLAGLQGHKAINYDPAGGMGTTGESITERAAFARRRVHRALDAVGGLDRMGGSVLWDVLGEGMSLNQWARNHRLDPKVSRGVLMATLAVLARMYRFDFHKPPTISVNYKNN